MIVPKHKLNFSTQEDVVIFTVSVMETEAQGTNDREQGATVSMRRQGWGRGWGMGKRKLRTQNLSSEPSEATLPLQK